MSVFENCCLTVLNVCGKTIHLQNNLAELLLKFSRYEYSLDISIDYILFFVMSCDIYRKSKGLSVLDIKCKPHMDLLTSKNNSVPSFCKYIWSSRNTKKL